MGDMKSGLLISREPSNRLTKTSQFGIVFRNRIEQKAVNETSMPPAKLREPGEV